MKTAVIYLGIDRSLKTAVNQGQLISHKSSGQIWPTELDLFYVLIEMDTIQLRFPLFSKKAFIHIKFIHNTIFILIFSVETTIVYDKDKGQKSSKRKISFDLIRY